MLKQAAVLKDRGELQAAEQLALSAYAADRSLEAALFAADCAVRQRDYQRALKHLAPAAEASSRSAVAAQLRSAELLHLYLHQFGAAEAAYRRVLAADPDNIEACNGLARLLAVCGRRREAIPWILQLVRQGEETDLIVLLARENGVIHDPDLLESARRAAGDDPHPLVAQAWHAISEERNAEALALLQQAVALEPVLPAAWAMLGRQLAEARRYDDLRAWSTQQPDGGDDFPEAWLARAIVAEHVNDAAGAARCYWEALRRAPELRGPTYRLAQLLEQVGMSEHSPAFEARVLQLQRLEKAQDRALFSSHPPGAAQWVELVRAYQQAGRIWEAHAWSRAAARQAPDDGRLRELAQELHSQTRGLPLELTVASANPARNIDLAQLPLPRIPSPEPKRSASQPLAGTLGFRDDAQAAGLVFTYDNGARHRDPLRMHEFTGGGIAVLDADLDGFPDVYCTQAGGSPATTRGERAPDRLFWNREGEAFVEISERSGVDERGFGQGATVGDYNSDGFADLYVANIGSNSLWTNNGDGTFSRAEHAGLSDDAWTTSCLLADVNGDGHPDIYDVNYLTGDDVFERLCRDANGSAMMCMPFDFDGAVDRLWLSDGAGGFVDATATALTVTPDGAGLGIAAWDAEGHGRLSLLVANDTTPNFFFSPQGTGAGFRLHEQGIVAGVALNSEGKAEGCMGIAVGDVDGDGGQDLCITNFLAESNTFYSPAGPGFFEDRTRVVDLHGPSLDVLGFGTQFLDADLDGELELFVTNGHIQNLEHSGRPYRMPPQLFRWSGGRFHLVESHNLGPYFQGRWLGRAVARLDWNRDKREDLLVGQLYDPTVLLTNTTERTGHAFVLRLIGTASNRDAIGTTVQLTVNGRTQTRQLSAGDGYQASNERVLIFGCGDATRVGELVVSWPSGSQQRFSDVAVPGDYIAIEGRGELADDSAFRR